MIRTTIHLDEQDRKAINLKIFQRALGAERVKLEADQCGLMYQGNTYPCFTSHREFALEESWITHYRGPDFCHDLVWAFAAESALAEQGLMQRYTEELANAVYPQWREIAQEKQVYRFWYSLIHASPLQRSVVMSRVLHERWREELQQIAEEAIGLAAIVRLDETKADAFVAYVCQLSPQQAEELMAIMALGRPDGSDFTAMRQETVGFGYDLPVLAKMMVGKGSKGPLVEYLRKGLEKFKLED